MPPVDAMSRLSRSRTCPAPYAQIRAQNIPKNIPTSLTLEETTALQELACDRRVLEIGSLFGYSTIVMAQVAQSVWAIDPHTGYPDTTAEPTIWKFLNNLARYGITNVVPIIAPADKVLPHLKVGDFDVVFIDICTHAKDLIFQASKLQPHYIAIHDYMNPQWPGATEAIDLFFKRERYPMRVVGRLAILDLADGPIWQTDRPLP